MEMKFHASHALFYLAATLGAGVFYTASLVVYRIFFHPLARYPGPWLAKITDAYQTYHAYKGDRHLEFWRLHQRYGPIVRFGPNSLSFNSAPALRAIYSHRANVRKAHFYDAFVHPASNTHNTRDKELHARKRRVLAQAFSDNAIKQMERYVLANARTFCEVIGTASVDEAGGVNDTVGAMGGGEVEEKKGWSGPKNMSYWCSYLAMDILGDLCFGKAFRMLESPENRFALDLVIVATTRHLICGTMPIIDKLGIDKFLFPNIAAGRARYMAYSKAQLMERTKLGDETDRRDFFYHLLKAKDPETGKGFSTPELWGESNLLIIAGSDTTSTAIAATLFYLVRNPAALARVTEEVRSAFSDVEEIRQGPALTGCTYLRACIDEAMRMSPSVGGLLPREVQAGGMAICDDLIPAGTVVGTPHYTIHHNEAYFPDPFRYAPERWMVGEQNPATGAKTTEAEVSVSQAAYCPFSIGPRGCIGKGLAYVEMTVSLARVIYMYDMRKAVGVVDVGEGRRDLEWGRKREDEFQLVDTFTSSKDGCMVEFRRREGA